MPSIEGFRAYARLMPDDEDPIIGECYHAAVQHAHDAGIPDSLFEGSGDPKLNLYVYALAAHWYDKRSFETDGYVKSAAVRMRRELMVRRDG